jgi:hypothetical protein
MATSVYDSIQQNVLQSRNVQCADLAGNCMRYKLGARDKKYLIHKLRSRSLLLRDCFEQNESLEEIVQDQIAALRAPIVSDDLENYSRQIQLATGEYLDPVRYQVGIDAAIVGGLLFGVGFAGCVLADTKNFKVAGTIGLTMGSLVGGFITGTGFLDRATRGAVANQKSTIGLIEYQALLRSHTLDNIARYIRGEENSIKVPITYHPQI